MRLHKQLRGPKSVGDTFEIKSTTSITYIHIGIQIPDRWPIEYVDNERALSTELSVNGVSYHINDTGVLEFDDISETSFNIVFNSDVPWGTIIDFVYDTDNE